MATLLGSLLVELGLESGSFKSGLTQAQKEMRRAQRSFEQVGKQMQSFGTSLTVGVTAPLVALSTVAVKGFIEQERAMADVNAALASMGEASGKTGDELLKMADAMEMRSLFDADVILKQVTSNLLTFGNIAGREFDRAQQAALDMATRLGGEPQAAAIMLGKALNDPVKGITALTRVGVQFTDAQKAQIAEMQAMGRTAEAQGVILAEVERQFAGAAEAAADVTPWRKAEVAIGQAMDKIGEAILPLIPPITNAIVSFTQAFTNLSPPMQQAVLIIGGLAAALGPLMIGLGLLVTSMAPFLAGIKLIGASGGVVMAAKVAIAGLGLTFGPVLAAIAGFAAAGVLIYRNWESIAPVLEDLWKAIQESLGKPFMDIVDAIKDALTSLFDGPFGDLSRTVTPLVMDFAKAVASFWGGNIVTIIKTLASVVGFVFSAIAAQIRFITSIFDGTLRKQIIDAVRLTYEGVKRWLQDRLAAVFNWIGDKTQQVSDFFKDMYVAVVGNSYVPDMVDGIQAEFNRLDAAMVDPARKAAQSVTDATREMAQEVRSLLDKLFPEIAAERQKLSDIALLREAERSGDIGADTRREGVRRLQGFDTGPLEQADLVNEAAKRVTDEMRKQANEAQAQTVAIAQSFKDMADSTVRTLQDLAGAIRGGGFLDILGAVIGLGLQLGSIGAFGSKIQKNINKPIPAFANGTNFAPGGLSLVGERGPELVNLPRGAGVMTNRELRNLSGTSVQVIPSPYFDVVVDGRIVQSAPALANAGAMQAQAMGARSARRTVRR